MARGELLRPRQFGRSYLIRRLAKVAFHFSQKFHCVFLLQDRRRLDWKSHDSLLSSIFGLFVTVRAAFTHILTTLANKN
jgi:hypothetical protein